MITQILGFIGATGTRRPHAAEHLAATAVALPADRRAHRQEPRRRATATARAGVLSRWWHHRRQRDEIGALSDELRADLGLAPKTPPLEEQLRFIATPDRFHLLPGPGRER